MRALLRLFYTMCLDEAEKGIDKKDLDKSIVVRLFRYKVYTLRKRKRIT